MSPSRSKTIVRPSGLTSTFIQVPSSVSNSTSLVGPSGAVTSHAGGFAGASAAAPAGFGVGGWAGAGCWAVRTAPRTSATGRANKVFDIKGTNSRQVLRDRRVRGARRTCLHLRGQAPSSRADPIAQVVALPEAPTRRGRPIRPGRSRLQGAPHVPRADAAV